MLLPYLTDTLGIAAVLAGLIVFLPEGVGRRAEPDRRAGSATAPPTRADRDGRSCSRAGCLLALFFALLFAAPDLGSKAFDAAVGAGAVRGVRDGVRLLPGALRRDARRDHRLLRRAHPVDDLAGRDPRVRDHAQRRQRPGDPRRVRRSGRLPGDGRGHRGAARDRRRRGVRRHPVGARSDGSPPAPARCASSCGSWPGRATSGCCWPPSWCRRSRPAPCSPGSPTSPAGCWSTRAPRRSCSSASSGRRCCSPPSWSALGQRIGKKQGYVASSLVLAAGRGAAALVAVGAATGGCTPPRRWSGVGYAGAQVFPMAMLPDAAAVDARRTGENRAGVYTGVWTAGETLGLALGPAVYALVLALGSYRSSDLQRRLDLAVPARLGADRHRARLLADPGRADPGQPVHPVPLLAGRRLRWLSLSKPIEVANSRDRRPRPPARDAGRATCPSPAAAPWPTSTTPGSRRPTGSAARRWRRTPAPTGSTRPRSRAC